MKIKTFNSLDLSIKLKRGLPAIFPTDTLPALAIVPEYAKKLWELKKRSLDKPLILMGSNTEELFELVLESAKEDAFNMATKYWPGALTMVLPAVGKEVSLLNLNQLDKTIGIRVPASQLAIELLTQIGPLATTSANLSGEAPVKTEKEAFEKFPEVALLGPIPWPKHSYLASTVIAWQSPGKWKLLRKGGVDPYYFKDLCFG